MTYIERLNEFHQWLESNTLPVNAQVLYFRLLNVFNRAGWPEHVQVDTRRLTTLAECEKDAAYRARDRLREAGFISYRKGKKGSPTAYFLSCRTTENNTETATIFETEYASEMVTENATHIKTKTKNKTKTISPLAPQDGAGDDFERFWTAYPRKVGKKKAQVAFAKVSVPIETLLAAIEKQKRTKQWQKENGQYIPHPTTWLNQGRWEDVVESASPATIGRREVPSDILNDMARMDKYLQKMRGEGMET